MTPKPSDKPQTIIIDDEQVPAHLREETGPKVTIHHFEWSTATTSTGLGALLKIILAFLVFVAVVFAALVGIWLLLFLGVVLGIIAAIRSILFPTGGRR